MATPRILSLSRTLFNKQTLIIISRNSYSSASSSGAATTCLSRLGGLGIRFHRTSPAPAPAPSCGSLVRTFATGDNNPNPDWLYRSPKEAMESDGCDFEHWLVITKPPHEGASPSRDEIIDSYIKTLTQILGSEEDEARKKIYSVSTRHYFGFGALVSEELASKLHQLPNVMFIIPDSYLDVAKKEYGGEPFINGQPVPYDPKYHQGWDLRRSRCTCSACRPKGKKPHAGDVNKANSSA